MYLNSGGRGEGPFEMSGELENVFDRLLKCHWLDWVEGRKDCRGFGRNPYVGILTPFDFGFNALANSSR
jgi:hypothetical protein